MGRTRTQDRLRQQGLAIVESLRPRQLPQRVFPLKWECAKKGFLAHLQRIGLGGGLGAALLVGGVRHHSHRLCELVGGLPQRLVLKRPRLDEHFSLRSSVRFPDRKSLRNYKAVPFPHGRCLFLTAVSVDDDQDLIRPDGGIATEIGVVHIHCQHALPHHGA
jgi:hypothetical protein